MLVQMRYDKAFSLNRPFLNMDWLVVYMSVDVSGNEVCLSTLFDSTVSYCGVAGCVHVG